MSNDVMDYEQDDANIETLTDDCLIYIFLELPLRDRIRIEGGNHIHFLFHNINIVSKYINLIFMYMCTENFFNNCSVQEMERIMQIELA